jgi:hypothetical protein
MELTSRNESADSRYHIKAQRSLLIRAYLKLYEADPNSINTCKLFWGIVFMVPVSILAGIFWVFIRPCLLLADHLQESYRAKHPPVYDDLEDYLPVEATPRKPSKGERFLSWVSVKATMLKFRLGPPFTAFARFVGRVLPYLAVVIMAAVVVFVAYTLATNWDAIWHAIWSVLPTAALVIGALLVVIGVGLGLIWLNEKTKAKRKPRQNRGLLKKAFESVHNNTCAIIDLEDE